VCVDPTSVAADSVLQRTHPASSLQAEYKAVPHAQPGCPMSCAAKGSCTDTHVLTDVLRTAQAPQHTLSNRGSATVNTYRSTWGATAAAARRRRRRSSARWRAAAYTCAAGLPVEASWASAWLSPRVCVCVCVCPSSGFWHASQNKSAKLARVESTAQAGMMQGTTHEQLWQHDYGARGRLVRKPSEVRRGTESEAWS